MNDISYFILSGLYQYQDINTLLLQAQANFPNRFVPNRIIRGVYGNFPNAIWNGEDMLFSSHTMLMPEITDILSIYSKMHLQIYLNFTNSEITQKECYDTYCNLILTHSLSSGFFNACVINSPYLNNFLQQRYPNLINLLIGKNNEITPECEKDINLPFLLNPKYNNNFEQLKLFHNKNEIIVTLNPYCISCPVFQSCLYKENLSQLTYDDKASKIHSCNNFLNLDHHNTPHFVTNQQIEQYIQYGYRHFIIEQMPTKEKQIEEYLYYFIKPEFYMEIKDYFYKNKEI